MTSTLTGRSWEPHQTIYLLDLYATLCSNPREVGKAWEPNVAVERYRQWLVDLIRDDYVILVTWRHQSYARASLERIALELGGWLPDEAHFRHTNQTAPEWKEWVLLSRIFTRFGRSPRPYLALESNGQTRAMYERHAIRAIAVPSGKPWTSIPEVPQRVAPASPIALQEGLGL